MEMHADKAVFDVDIRWAANAEIVVEAGVKAVPLLITLDKLRFSGTLRVELAPLVPVVSIQRSKTWLATHDLPSLVQ